MQSNPARVVPLDGVRQTVQFMERHGVAFNPLMWAGHLTAVALAKVTAGECTEDGFPPPPCDGTPSSPDCRADTIMAINLSRVSDCREEGGGGGPGGGNPTCTVDCDNGDCHLP